MRLLFLTPQLPYPPHKGTTIRNFHLLKNLAARHEVTLLSFGDGSSAAALSELRRYCTAVEVVAVPRRSLGERLVDLPFPARPDLVRRLRSPELGRRLRMLLEGPAFDLVQIEGLEMALHWEALIRPTPQAANQRLVRMPRAILDDHNAEYVLQHRAYQIDRLRPAKWHGAFYSFLQWQKLARYEGRFCGMVDAVIAASDLDRQALHALDKRLRVFVVPNGVDTAHYQPRPGVPSPGSPRLIFTGTMDFRPNVDGTRWLCERVWPAVVERVPEASLWIVGSDPTPEIRRLGDGQRIVVTGAVDDVRPYLASAALAVVPLRIGGGSRLKVLEAMAAGVPVVSTQLGCEGIAVGPHTAVIVDRPDEFSRAIVDLLRDEQRRRALSHAARDFVAKAYDWSVIVPRLDEIYCEVRDS